MDQVTINGLTYMSPEPMLEGKKQNITLNEKELWTLQNGQLKRGLTDRLSIYQERLDVLGNFFFSDHNITWRIYSIYYLILYYRKTKKNIGIP